MGNLTQNFQSEVATMSSREIAKLTGKRHDNVKSDIQKMVAELEIDVLTIQDIYFDSMNRKQTEYRLDRDLTDCLLTGYSAKARMAVIKRWRELEVHVAAPALPNFADPIEAAEAWIKAKKAERLAIATKAQISSRREASVMGKLSAASRKMKQLEQELGRNAVEATVTAVEKAVNRKYGKQGFRPLKNWCKDNGVKPNKVPCPRYGEVVAWPAEAWIECYGVDLTEVFGGGES